MYQIAKGSIRRMIVMYFPVIYKLFFSYIRMYVGKMNLFTRLYYTPALHDEVLSVYQLIKRNCLKIYIFSARIL